MEHLAKLKVPHLSQAMGQLFPLLGLITVIKQTMPPEGRQALLYCRRALRSVLNPFCFYNINEFEGNTPNDLYRDVHLHLESVKAYHKAKRVSLFRQPNSSTVSMRLADSSDVIVDTYKGMTVWWTHYEDPQDMGRVTYRGPFSSGLGGSSSTREFQLRVRKRDKLRLLPEYLEFITRSSSTYSGKTRDIRIYTNTRDGLGFHHYTDSGSRRMWIEVPYKHPSTFDTLAMDPFLKDKILADLTSFTNDKAFYEKTGRAWKRGYLLYGPPGTGKSSMIAAMANFLKYDIYDLELSQVRNNGDLRQLLIQTTNRSIIVLEDIDCSVKFTGSRARGKKHQKGVMQMPGDFLGPEVEDKSEVTLSGLLNFVDGLWSCCGDERIIVFTTNHVEKLDKALLRPGRMDMQIELSYCTFPAFRVLAHNYLSIEDHPLFSKLEATFPGTTLTPAQIAELLIKDKSDIDVALESVMCALESKVHATSHVTSDVSSDGASDGASEATSVPASDHRLAITTVKGDSQNVSKGDMVEVLKSVIEVLEKNTAFQNQKVVTQSHVKDLVRSVQSAILRNAAAGELDSAVENVVQALATKLPLSDIHHIFGIDQPENGVSESSGVLISSSSNGVHKEIITANGKGKEVH